MKFTFAGQESAGERAVVLSCLKSPARCRARSVDLRLGGIDTALNSIEWQINHLRSFVATTRTPVAVVSAQRRMGEYLATWRKLRQLTAAQVADRAGISRYTVMRLEGGEGASMENLLRVARALGVLDI